MNDRFGQPPSSAQGQRPTLHQAARVCPPGAVIAARRGRVEMVVARLATGEVFALPDRCPHAGVALSEGFIEGGQLVCPMHGWAFDVASGQCVTRPDVTVPVTRLAPRQRTNRATRAKSAHATAGATAQQSLDLSTKP